MPSCPTSSPLCLPRATGLGHRLAGFLRNARDRRRRGNVLLNAADLDDRMLDDIGLDRGQLLRGQSRHLLF